MTPSYLSNYYLVNYSGIWIWGFPILGHLGNILVFPHYMGVILRTKEKGYLLIILGRMFSAYCQDKENPCFARSTLHIMSGQDLFISRWMTERHDFFFLILTCSGPTSRAMYILHLSLLSILKDSIRLRDLWIPDWLSKEIFIICGKLNDSAVKTMEKMTMVSVI